MSQEVENSGSGRWRNIPQTMR